jgi:predicted TIM-barrel fold metal-dependent hydrolase
MPSMRIDAHVHVCAFTPEHGRTSDRLLDTLPFRFMRWRLGIPGRDAATERAVEQKLVDALAATPELDAAVVLAFDGVRHDDGTLDEQRTHLYVTNDYVIDLCRRHANMRFGASVHPFRTDAVAEIERCVAAGAVLLKWLPIVQGFSPADERCIPVYEALAHHKLPLLSHTGGERSLIRVNDAYADPRLLEPALQRGVTVIAAHCGTRSTFAETDFFGEFRTLCQRYENLYGDTAALCLPARWHVLRRILDDPLLHGRVIHGSDWPIPPLPPPAALGTLAERNWLRRDVLIKRRLGFDDDYFERASRLLRLGHPAS